MEGGLDSLQFIRDGCIQADGSKDCILSCADTSRIFADFPILWNSFMLATLAMVAGDIKETWSDLYKQMADRARDFEVPDLWSLESIRMISSAFTCTNMSCIADSSLCPVTSIDRGYWTVGILCTLASLRLVCHKLPVFGNANITCPGYLPP